MSELTNLYQAPAAELIVDESTAQPLDIVGSGRRFIHYLIDVVLYQIVKFCILILLTALWGPGIPIINNSLLGIIFGLSVMLAYYIFMEAIFQRTLGKMITGTIVVNEDGKAPSLGQVMKRSFSRLVPFEAFSCFGDQSRGWHDSWSGTYVVRVRKP